MRVTRRAFSRMMTGAGAALAVWRPGTLRAAAGGVLKPPFAMQEPTAPVFPARVFDIRKHGANAGGQTACTQAIAAAIADCAKAGGGRVLVPAGVWLTGPIHLKSNVELHVAEGAELRIAEPPAMLHCHACQTRHDLDELILRCPACGSDQITIDGGQELLLQSIELEE